MLRQPSIFRASSNHSVHIALPSTLTKSCDCSKAVSYRHLIAGMYLTLFCLGAFVIAAAEQLTMSVCLYETASAVATVGLTLGITPQLGILSQGVLIALMFLGRVGGLTLIYAAFGSSPAHSRLPQEKIAIG